MNKRLRGACNQSLKNENRKLVFNTSELKKNLLGVSTFFFSKLRVNVFKATFKQYFRYIAACPQVFSSGGTCTLYLHFWGCNVPSNSSFGGTKKMNCIFSTQGRAFCILRVIDTGLSLLYRVGENFFFLSDIGSERNWGFCVPLCLSHHFFCNIVYNLSHFVFIQNWMQDYLYIVMIIKQLN